jgi:hypothetical protein
LPGGYYLQDHEHQDDLVLRRPDGTPVSFFSKKQPIPQIVEEVVKIVVEDVIVNAGPKPTKG